MSEPLRKFLESACKFTGANLESLFQKLTDMGAEQVEHLYEINTEQDYEEAGISKILRRKLMKEVGDHKQQQEKTMVTAIIHPPETIVEERNKPDEEMAEPIHSSPLVAEQVQMPKIDEVSEKEEVEESKEVSSLEDHDMIDTSSKPKKTTQIRSTDFFKAPKVFNYSGSKSTSSKGEIVRSDSDGIFILYQSFDDFGNEYKMKKIKLNDDSYLKFVKGLTHEKVQVVGIYGCFTSALIIANQHLGGEISNSFNKIEEGIIFLQKDEKVVAIYKCPEPSVTFAYDKGTDQANLASTYLRYLVDICESIIVALPDGFKVNPDNTNPFREQTNHGAMLTEKYIKPDESMVITKVPLAADRPNIDNKVLQSYPDQQKFLCQVDMQRDKSTQDVKFYFSTQQICDDYKFSSYGKLFTFNELKDLIIKTWSADQKFFQTTYEHTKFQDKIEIILMKFIPKDLQSTFKERCRHYQQQYMHQMTDLKKDLEEESRVESLPHIKQFFKSIQKYQCCRFKEVLDQKIQPQEGNGKTWWKSVKEFLGEKKPNVEDLKCDVLCKKNRKLYNHLSTYKYKFQTDDWKILEKAIEDEFPESFDLHKTIKYDELSNLATALVKDFLELKNNFKETTKFRQNSLREHILTSFFKDVEPLANKEHETISNSVSIRFMQMSVVRDTDHRIVNWIINKMTIPINHKFGKESQGEVIAKQILFVTDTAGLVSFENTPEGKNSIFYFNISSKTQPLFQHIMTSSIKAHVIVEPQNRQWCIINNNEKRVNIGKLTKEGKIEDGIPVSIIDQMSDGLKIESIQSACFLPLGEKILLINQSNDIFEYKWQSCTLQAVFKKKNEDGKGVVKTKILPKNPGEKYLEVQASTDGKNILLRSKNSIDIYDLNWDFSYNFPIGEDFCFFKTFSDKINNFVVIFSRSTSECYQLVGLTTTRTIETELTGKNLQNKIFGNPIFDHLYHAFRKFGNHSDFIGSPSNTNLHLITGDMQVSEVNNLKKYFTSLGLKRVELYPVPKFGTIKLENESYILSTRLKMILLGRVAIHVATIENSTLVPLRDGINISDQIAENLLINQEKSTDLIEKITQMIKFGIYEKYLVGIKRDIKVVSIVGRQSSGKSYVMNRFFGTRFNVAATRCTDGIWMSLVEIYDQDENSKLFMILDCEGLFSARRNEQEEMKLCLALAAISDIMILNQDSAFNRHLNSLFSNFSKCVGRIKGKKLFKGKLLMLIRDISSEDASGTYRELHSNFVQLDTSKQRGFLSQVFQGELLSQCMNNFKNDIFSLEVEEIRAQYYMSLDEVRWNSGYDLIESMKITLAQIFSDDDTDIDIHKIKIQCDHLFAEALEMFFNGGDSFKGKNSVYNMDVKFEEEEYKISVNQSEIMLNKELNDLDIGQSNLTKVIINNFINQSRKYSIEFHNAWIDQFNTYLRELLEQRKNFILAKLQEALPSDSDYQEIISTYHFKLKNFFEIYIPNVLYCGKKCRDCKRLCSQRLNHKNDCHCETSHICQAQCEQFEQCKLGNYLCVEIFGHDKVHRCSESNHKCQNQCNIKDCKFLCTNESGHSDSVVHDCGNKHFCQVKCEDNFCTRICQFQRTAPHDQHTCGESMCIHKCALCDRQCIFPDHMHDKLIREGNIDNVVYKSEEGKSSHLTYHICDQKHKCKYTCEADGVCQVGYNVEERTWKSLTSEEGFPYQYFNPIIQRNPCNIIIEQYRKSHDKDHDCKIGNHRCTHQCPECKSFCSKDIEHEGLHYTNNHRNKENSVFASQNRETISIKHEGKKREYKIGESCQPENCTTSCGRKGRAHYHIKECKDIETCEGKINPHVRHATEKFEPYTDKDFDKWLCVNYWNSMNWEPPIEGIQLEDAQSCNFVCGHPCHGDELKFCNGSALHSDAHSFDCDHKEGFSSNIIDLVFCCDTTGSMGSYIKRSKTACKQIVTDVLKLPGSEVRSFKFAFVAYRDHPPQESTYVTKVQALADESVLQTFLSSVTAAGGGDGPEAVLDGLYDSIHKVGWREKSLRYIFHIADAPPHGMIYTRGSDDGFPLGCPCGIKIETLAASMKEMKIRYKLLKIGSYTNTMASEFKSKIEDYEESELDSAVQLDLKMSGIVCRDIKQEEIDVIKFD